MGTRMRRFVVSMGAFLVLACGGDRGALSIDSGSLVVDSGASSQDASTLTRDSSASADTDSGTRIDTADSGVMMDAQLPVIDSSMMADTGAGDAGLTRCALLPRPTSLTRPPSGSLPCEFLPPDVLVSL